MRGHEPLIKMRLAGKKPSIVFINDFPCKLLMDWANPGEKYGEVWEPDHATISTAGDPMSSIDLRFLVGLRVSISAHRKDRAIALFNKAKECGATTVAAGTEGWSEIFHKELKNG